MKIPILLISEFIGVVAVVIILSISPVIRNKRPLRFLYPRREGTASVTVGILILVLTAVVQRFQPDLFAQLMNFTTYPTLVNTPKPSFGKSQCHHCPGLILGSDDRPDRTRPLYPQTTAAQHRIKQTWIKSRSAGGCSTIYFGHLFTGKDIRDH